MPKIQGVRPAHRQAIFRIVSDTKIVATLLGLPAKQRAEIAGILLRSLDGEEGADEGVDAAWAAEIERRVEEIRRGVVKTTPAEQVMKRLRAKVRRARQ